jgi:tungstate transport system permease protein
MPSSVLSQAFSQAIDLIASADAGLLNVVALSLKVSLTACLWAFLPALALGWVLATGRFRGHFLLASLTNAFMGLPPVMVGLVVYLLLSRSGPLGSWGILFTPKAMILAQGLLVLPLMAALARQVFEDAWSTFRELFQSLQLPYMQQLRALAWDVRWSLLTVVLAGIGRAIAEVGAVMMVGGNIDGLTRVMTTTIALETSKGDLALALSLGLILMLIVWALNLSASALKVRFWTRHD